MISARAVGRRLAFAVLAMYAVMTIVFLFVALTPDPFIAVLAYANRGDPEAFKEAAAAYRAARNLDDPLLQRYLRWLWDVTTLDWGVSYSQNRPVMAVLADRVPATLWYLVPSAALSTAGGVALGIAVGVTDRDVVDWLSSWSVYSALGVPNFWLAGVFAGVILAAIAGGGGGGGGIDPTDPLAPGTLTGLVFPTLVLSTTLFAAQFRYARAEALEQVGTDFVKLLRAQGAGRRMIARRILRLVSLPLIALSVTELIGVLVVEAVIIEEIFRIPGLGDLTLVAVFDRDLPLILGITMFISFVGILATILQDLLYQALDPRVGDRSGE